MNPSEPASPPVPPPAPQAPGLAVEDLRPEYWAFISYRHLDNQQLGRQWATWLHQQLESYDVPEDLVGKTNERGDVIPERIFPVFRDEEELPAEADLASSVRAAVERSKYMIVLCSPRSAESKYVGEEVAYFKQRGKGDRLLAVMIEGAPNASWDIGKQKAGASPYQECFPKALMHPVAPDGTLDESVRAEPIAADFRILPGGQQGWTNPAAYREALEAQGTHRTKAIRELVDEYEKKLQLGLNKVLAGALGVPLSTLTQRDKAFQLEKARRRARTLAAWLTVSTLLAIGAVVGGVFGWSQMLEAQRQRSEAVRQRDLVKSRSGALSATMSWMNSELQKIVNENPSNLRYRETLLRHTNMLGTVHEKLGHAQDALNCNEEALAIREELGDLQMKLGDTQEARGHYETALSMAEELVKLNPQNSQFQRYIWTLLWRFGDVEEKLGRKAEAKARFGQVIDKLQEMKSLGILAPADEEWLAKAEARRAALDAK